MRGCDGCGDETSNMYYIPRGMGNICMCPKCVQLILKFTEISDNNERMMMQLKKAVKNMQEEEEKEMERRKARAEKELL